MTFPKDALPPVDRSRGGFWSLTHVRQGLFHAAELAERPHQHRHGLLDANELKFAADGSLTIHLSHEPPAERSAGELAAGAGGPVRADRAGLRADAAAPRWQLQAAERNAKLLSGSS